jgi:hypothetical protein
MAGLVLMVAGMVVVCVASYRVGERRGRLRRLVTPFGGGGATARVDRRKGTRAK